MVFLAVRDASRSLTPTLSPAGEREERIKAA